MYTFKLFAGATGKLIFFLQFSFYFIFMNVVLIIAMSSYSHKDHISFIIASFTDLLSPDKQFLKLNLLSFDSVP